MEVVHDPEPAEPAEPTNQTRNDSGESPTLESAGAPAEVASQTPYPSDAPVEPSLDSDQASSMTKVDLARTREALLRFHLYGRLPKDAPPAGSDASIPAMLYPYRDLSRVRYEYPVCVNGNDPERAFLALTFVIDDVLVKVTEEGDAREQLKRDLYRLELSIKTEAESSPEKDLAHLWDDAVAKLLKSDHIDEDCKPALRDTLNRVRDKLPTASRLVGCNPQTAALLFTELAILHWHEKSREWSAEVDTLIARLRNILSADKNRSEEARSPGHLRESVADEEMDFEAMSTIIGVSAPGGRLPESRRQRIATVLATLVDVRPVFGTSGKTTDGNAVAPFDIAGVVTTCSRALEERQKRMKAMLDFFKAVHIARLEIDNRYREHVHDDYFSGFDATHLTEEEFSLCPPVLLRLAPESLTNAEAGALLDMLGSGVSVKVLVEIDDLTGETNMAGPSVAVWPSRIASTAMALGEVFVTQAPLSRVADLRTRFSDGFAWAGPALFAVYTGNAKTHERLATYLAAEAAAESRLFPVFTFDPGRGDTFAERMDISANARVESDWPVEPMRYRNADGDDATMDLAFTPADYLACDRRFDKQFWHVNRAQWHEDMLPLGDYIERDLANSDSAIPYILIVDKDGRLGRAVVTRTVIATALNCRSSWRHLQENGGINNSFALRLLSQEKQKLDEVKQREVEAIEQNYSVQLDQDIGDLTEEIMGRIVARLLAEEGASAPQSIPVAGGGATAAPSEPAVAPAAEPAPVEEEEPEEELASFDDPYIDIPLCTSCNECTQLNAQLFAYNQDKQAYIKDATAGTFQDLVRAAELCPVRIIHPGKPKNPDEPGLDEWVERAVPFN